MNAWTTFQMRSRTALYKYVDRCIGVHELVYLNVGLI